MASIRIVYGGTIQAANHKESNQRMELTPWDLQMLMRGPIERGLLFRKPQVKICNERDDQETIIHTLINHLKASLSQTLGFFPPLAGRLVATDHDDETVSFSVDCNNAGAFFIHAVADGITLSDILTPLHVPNIVYSFFPPTNAANNYQAASKPLLVVQVTELVDSMFIAFRANHVVFDGTSFWHFLNSWSEISRGNFLHLSKYPIFDRSFFDDIAFPIRISKPYLKQINEIKLFSSSKHLEIRIFHFSKEGIARLKAKANAEVGTDKLISSLQALLCNFWKSVIRAKSEYNEETMTSLHFVVGARPRLHDLPEQYFGNAVRTESVNIKVKEVLEKRLGNIAWELNKFIATQTEEKIKNFLESWTKCPDLRTMDIGNNSLFVTSSPWFDLYGNDFGWGRPVAVINGPGSHYSDGKIITVSQGAEEGSIDVDAWLPSQTLEAMAMDQDFLDFVTNLK